MTLESYPENWPYPHALLEILWASQQVEEIPVEPTDHFSVTFTTPERTLRPFSQSSSEDGEQEEA